MGLPDLTAARATAAGLLGDTCTIVGDAEGTDDDVLDPDTLELGPAPNDTTDVYSGPCLVGVVTNRDRPAVLGGEQYVTDLYRLRLPSEADPRPGNWVTIDAVHDGGDATLVDRQFRILEVTRATLLVTRQAVMAATERVPR